MARTRKSIQPLNLHRYDVLIEDRSVRSDYFKITQFDGYLYGGRNAFLLAGNTVLRPNSNLLVEILNKNGTTVFSAPVEGFIEGNSRLIQIEVYDDTPIGPGKIVILGCAAQYLDGTPIPPEWQDKYNVRWVGDVTISPLKENKTPIRFEQNPLVDVEEKFYSVAATASFSQSITEPVDIQLEPKFFNVYHNGYVVSITGPDVTTRCVREQLGGIITGSIQFTTDEGLETANIALPITRLFTRQLLESEGQLIVTDKGRILKNPFLSSSGQYDQFIPDLGTVGVTSSVAIQYNKLIQIDEPSSSSLDAISFAQLRVTDLSTISGEINKVRVSYKSATKPSAYVVLGDVPVGVSELLAVDTGSRIAQVGRFREVVLSDYWYSATMSLATGVPAYYYTSSLIASSPDLRQSCRELIDGLVATPPVVGGTFGTGISYFIGSRTTASIELFPRSEYTLSFEALVTNTSASNTWTGADASIEVYIIPTPTSTTKLLDLNPLGQFLGKLTPVDNFTIQNFETVELNFEPKIIESGEFEIRFVVYGGFWNIANVSLKPAEERFFSPDEISLLLPNEFYFDDLLEFKVEFLDVSNNSTPIVATSLPTYFTGSRQYVLRSGDTMEGELEIKGLPIYQTLLQDHFTGLITGGLLLTSSEYSQAYTITAGAGFYIDNSNDPLNPIYKYIAWPDLTVTASAFPTSGSVSDYPRTNVAIALPSGEPTVPVFGLTDGKAILAGNADVVEQADPFTSEDYRNYIVLGRLAHVNSTNIQRTLSLPLTVFARQYHWFDFAYNLDPVNITGNVYGPGGTNLTLEKTEGQTYRIGSNYKNNPSFPDITTDPSTNPTTFAYRYRSATPDVFSEQPATTVVTGSFYDNGTGTLATVNNNQWTVQRIYFFGATRTTRIQYGQAVYNSRTDAAAGITTEAFVSDPNLAGDAIFRGYLLLRGGAVNLSDINDAEFIQAGVLVGGSGGGGGATTLEALSDVDVATKTAGDVLTYDGSVWIAQPVFPYTGSAIISGSLYVTDHITGSLFGTSSWAVSASRAIVAEEVDILSGSSSSGTGQYSGSFTGSLLGTASYAYTASYVLNSVSSDPWADYGTPDWRTDFAGSSLDLTGWVVANGSSGSLIPTPFGTYKSAASASVCLTRAITPGVPFVCDFRWNGIGNNNTGGATARYALAGVQQNAGTNRLFMEIQQANGGSVPVPVLRHWNGSLVVVLPNTGWTNYYTYNESEYKHPFTMRLRSDGTTYTIRYLWDNPAVPVRLSTTAEYLLSSGLVTNPGAIAVAWDGPAGKDHRLLHVAFQTTNVDDYFGL